jgi:uncharacterized protein DUF6580
VECFVGAIPFFRNTLLRDLLYSALLFGALALAEKRWPILAEDQSSFELEWQTFQNQIAAKQKKGGAGCHPGDARCLNAESLANFPPNNDSAGRYEKRLNSNCAKHGSDRQA